jgi:hypothetical protein
MTHSRNVFLAGLVAALMFLVNSAVAGAIETLMMPGKVIEGHAKYEAECDRCHLPFSRDKQDALCHDCHEKVAADIASKQGYHGRAGVHESECRHCHTDHKGRDADVIQLGTETFDHEFTDYPLRGAHVSTSCNLCHLQEKKYRDAPASCKSCHTRDDVHKGGLGDKCSDCHTERSWRRTEFDHDKTEFVLREKHAELDCNSCHVDTKYKETARECFACHLLNDVHAGRYGQNCNDCHNQKDWKLSSYDHRGETGYPLVGKHRSTKCDVCHTGQLFKDKLDTQCIACHRADDQHGGRYGKQCGTCHTPDQWGESRFDHNKKTEFPLQGEHEKAKCTACHRSEPRNEKLDTSCHSCHAIDDVHAGQQGNQCGDCHDENGWGNQVRFNHDLASFPLIGLHAAVPCEECHISARFKTAASNCNACHQPDDTHERKLGLECEKCHNPNGWGLWEFDHDTQTEFRLNGAHAGLDCLSCHDTDATHSIRVSASCADCHRSDDVHDGQFGRYCERCHNDESFDDVDIR